MLDKAFNIVRHFAEQKKVELVIANVLPNH